MFLFPSFNGDSFNRILPFLILAAAPPHPLPSVQAHVFRAMGRGF